MNIRVYRRNNKLVRVRIRDKDGNPLKMGEMSFLFVAGPITKTSLPGGGINVFDSDGEIIVEIPLSSKDTNIEPGYYAWELLVTDISGARYSPVRGIFSILHSLTSGRG